MTQLNIKGNSLEHDTAIREISCKRSFRTRHSEALRGTRVKYYNSLDPALGGNSAQPSEGALVAFVRNVCDAEKESDLQNALNRLSVLTDRMVLRIDVYKTKVLVFDKDESGNDAVELNTTSALANYATEACVCVFFLQNVSKVRRQLTVYMDVTWTSVILTVALLLTWFTTKLRDRLSHWQKRGVPFVPLNWRIIIDSMLSRKYMTDWWMEVYKKLEGHPFGGYYNYVTPMLMVRDPEILRTVLVKGFSNFHDNDFHLDVSLDPIAGRNPFFLKGERWRTVRSQITPAFTPGKIKPMFSLMTEVCQEMKTYLEKVSPQGPVEAKEMSNQYTSDVVASCAYGIKGDAFTNPDAKFLKAGQNLFKMSGWGTAKMIILFFFPKLAGLLRLRYIL
uniref:Cytochrome P450 n=1 Tax=Timema douglasi TaxID=61478 RepID=A0A7R8VQJ5_TIMDO|nr:unnamed protein product [Timema douglasi]